MPTLKTGMRIPFSSFIMKRKHRIQKISEYEDNSWHFYCENHPLMNLENSRLSNISPSQFWAISEQYADLVKHLQQQVRLIRQFGFNGGVP